MFRQVRADVMAATAEHQVPWESSSLVGDFYFRQSTGAGTVATPAPAAESQDDALQVASLEAQFWTTIRDSDNAEYFREYLRQWPDGVFSGLARIRLSELEGEVPGGEDEPAGGSAASQAPPAAAEVDLAWVEGMLEEAQRAEQEDRLTTPRGNNAYESYRAVLDRDPTSRAAQAGLERIMARYLGWADRSLRRGDARKAEIYLARAEKVAPGDNRVAAMRRRLARVAGSAAASPPSRPAGRPAAGRPARLVRGSALVAVPKDGRFGGTRYSGSGRTTAQIVVSAAARHLDRVEALRRPHSLKDNLAKARAGGFQYLIVPQIEHWEDRNTTWSGRPDKVSIVLAIYAVRTGKVVDSTRIDQESGWSLGATSDKPEDLLPQPVETYFASIQGRL
jgi:hypothetical protein